MELINITLNEIEFGERFRKEYENVDMLAESIRTNGNVQLISVSINPNKESDKPYLLSVGGRRYKAFEYLVNRGYPQYDKIHVCFYNKVLTDLERRSIEAAENIERENFTYAEECTILKHIHDLQIGIHGEKVAKSPDASGWSKADTAKMVSKSPATITQDIELARAIEEFPELGLDQMKNKTEARKRLRKVQDMIMKQELAKNYSQTLENSDSVKQRLINSFILNDFFEGVKKVPDGTIDLVEIDPPYAIDLKRNKKENECVGYNEIKSIDYVDFMRKVLMESYRTMKPSSWLILWFAPAPWFEVVYNLLKETGFDVTRMCGIWVKGQGQTMQPLRKLANSYEMFFYVSKGRPHIAKPGSNNQFIYPPVPSNQKIHPTERPSELIEDILTTFVKPDSQIMVPFLGSGKTITAAHKVQMSAFGFELTQNYKDSFIIRINEEF